MSIETLITRKCDICGKIMSNDFYYSCQRQHAIKNEWTQVYGGYQQYTTDGIPSYNTTHKDVCSECWTLLENLKKEAT